MRKAKKIDKLTGKIKCPSMFCRRADAQIIGGGDVLLNISVGNAEEFLKDRFYNH